MVCILLSVAPAPARGQAAGKSSLVARVGNTGFVRVDVESFATLDARQRQLAYWLVQASIAIDPIVYDQFSRFGLRQKRLLEEIAAAAGGDDSARSRKIAEFTRLFWANRGNHNEITAQKFLPEFSFEELESAALAAQKRGAFLSYYADLEPISTPSQLQRELEELRASLFDPDFEPLVTAKSPRAGLDIIQASSNTFYEGLRLSDLAGFRGDYPLNSRLVKGPDGRLEELVYRAGTRAAKCRPASMPPSSGAPSSIWPRPGAIRNWASKEYNIKMYR